MTLSPGTSLGPYEIVSLLGMGGMGEVYRARDPRLGRDVAIKILPPAAAVDAERRSRFEREAKAVAALNHPNIVTIHAVEEAEGVPFFTMEYVEGRTLGQVIPRRGLPLDELLRIAIPLTDAVGAAHQRGILHRDLKPANVMVTPEVRVKVLDFGLAKLKEAMVQAEVATAATAEPTGEGRILGTAAYMSPEQAEGKALDQRSDTFSLGVLLYEMATGQRPFKGDTSVSVISAILKDTPGSVTDLRPDLPRDLAKILKRALNKDPEHRYQSAKDLRNDLETVKEDLDSGEAPPATPGSARMQRPRRRWVVPAMVALVAGVAVAGTWWAARVLTPSDQRREAHRFFEDFTLTYLTTEQASERAVAISHDGRYVAYASVEKGREGLRVRQTDAPAAVQVMSPADVQYASVTFSPDSAHLYYSTYPHGDNLATLYEVPVLGGVPRKVIEDVDTMVTFSPDGARFAFIRNVPAKSSAVMIANADGSGERALATLPTPRAFTMTDVAWSRDGRLIAAAQNDGSGKAHLVTVDAATGAIQAVGQKAWDSIGTIAWPEGARLVLTALDRRVADAEQVWEVSLPDGATRRITKDIASYSTLHLTADARTLVAVRSEWRGSLWVAPASQLDRGSRVPSVADTVRSFPIRWTADGRILYTANATGSGNFDLWAVRPDGSELRQLTTAPGVDSSPTVVPGSGQIVFLSDRGGRLRLWRMDADGGRQVPLTNGSYDYCPVASADGRSVYFVRMEDPDLPMYVVPLEGGQPTLVSRPSSVTSAARRIPAGFFPFQLSPDGSLILGLYFDDQSRPRYAFVPADGRGAGPKPGVVPVEFGRNWLSAAWAPDGAAITVVRVTDGAANLWRQPLGGGPATRITSYPPGEDMPFHAWSPDGRHLALLRGSAERRIVIMREVAGNR
jgi:eukaryotic-like serine/threonine-protein kinase